jgi:ribosomal protein L20
MTELKNKLQKLSKSHPIPGDEKLERRLLRLERMRDFYIDKIPEAPVKQGMLFSGFVTALVYAITTIRMYRKLTTKLKELAEDDDGQQGQNSN